MEDAINATSQSGELIRSLEEGNPVRTYGELARRFEAIADAAKNDGDVVQQKRARWDFELCTLATLPMIVLSARDRIPDDHQRWAPRVLFQDGSGWPSPDTLYKEARQYFEERLDSVRNPLLKARYADLLWAQGSVRNRKFALMAIESYLTSAQSLFSKDDGAARMEAANAFDQAATLLTEAPETGLVSRLAETLSTLVVEQANAPALRGRWTLDMAEILFYLAVHKKSAGCVSRSALESVLKAALSTAEEYRHNNDPHSAFEFFRIVRGAARLLGDERKCLDAALATIDCIVRQAEERAAGPNGSALAGAGLLEQAVKEYSRLRDKNSTTAVDRIGIQSKMDELKTRLRELYRAGSGEMRCVQASVEVSQEDIHTLITKIMDAGSISECLSAIAAKGELIPNVDLARQQAQATLNSGGLLSLLPTKIISDEMAVDVEVEGGDHERLELDRNLIMWVEINSQVMLGPLFSALTAQKHLDANQTFDFLDRWGIIDPDNLEIIRVGLERYFSGDMVSALHILTPQFEDVLRTLFAKAGEPVTRPRRDQRGWQFETFGAFLARQAVRDTLTPDIWNYIRVVMDAPAGWNLRNRIAHGIIAPERCGRASVETVIHLFLILTLFRVEPIV